MDSIKALLQALWGKLPKTAATAHAEEMLANLSPMQRKMYENAENQIWKEQFRNDVPQELQRRRAVPADNPLSEYSPYVTKMPMIDPDYARNRGMPTKKDEAVELLELENKRYDPFKNKEFEFRPGRYNNQIFPDEFIQGAIGSYNGVKYGPVAPIRYTDTPFMQELPQDDPAVDLANAVIQGEK